MGVDPYSAAIMGGVSLVSGAMESRRQARAGKKAASMAQQAPFQGLDLYAQLEQQVGTPSITGDMYDPFQARTLTGGDYDKLQENLFLERVGLWQEPFQEAMRAINYEEEQRGLSSLGADQRYRLGGRLGDMLRSEAAGSVAARYGMQLQEQDAINRLGLAEAERRTAFNLRPVDLLLQRQQLGLNAAGVTSGAGQAAAQHYQTGQAGASSIIGQTGSSVSNLMGGVSAYNFLRQPPTSTPGNNYSGGNYGWSDIDTYSIYGGQPSGGR